MLQGSCWRDPCFAAPFPSETLSARLFLSTCEAQSNALNLRLQHNWLNGVNRFCAWGILCFWSCCAWRLSAPALPPLLCVTVMDRWLTIQAFNNCNLLPHNITLSPTHCEQSLLPSSGFKVLSPLLLDQSDVSCLKYHFFLDWQLYLQPGLSPFWTANTACKHKLILRYPISFNYMHVRIFKAPNTVFLRT